MPACISFMQLHRLLVEFIVAIINNHAWQPSDSQILNKSQYWPRGAPKQVESAENEKVQRTNRATDGRTDT